MGDEEGAVDGPDPWGGDVAVTHILVVSDPVRSREFWILEA